MRKLNYSTFILTILFSFTFHFKTYGHLFNSLKNDKIAMKSGDYDTVLKSDSVITNKYLSSTQEPEGYMLGNTEIYGSVTTQANRKAVPVTFRIGGEIQSITIYHNGGTGNVLLGVYSDNLFCPTSLLGVTPSTPINGAEGWQTVSLISPVSVSSGQTVWLSFVFENNPGIRFAPGTPSRAQSSDSWSSGLPASFGALTFTGYKYSVFCNYLPVYDATPVFSEYTFFETNSTSVYDSNDSNNGEIINSVSRIDGINGGGLQFSGSGYITLGKVFSDNIQNQITLSAWIKPASTTGGYQGIIMHGGPNVDTYGLYIRPDSKGLAFKTSGTTNAWFAVDNVNDLWDGNWHLVTVTYNGSQKTIYLDDNILTTSEAIGVIESGTGYNLLIGAGRDETVPSLLYEGLMDEVKIYNYSLNSNEVEDMYNPVAIPVVTGFTILPINDVSYRFPQLTVPIRFFKAVDDNFVSGYKLTETSVTPNADDVGWSSSPPTSYTFDSPGDKKLYAWAKDADGNVSVSLFDDVSVATLSSLDLDNIYRGNENVFDEKSTSQYQRAIPITFYEKVSLQSISVYHEGGTGNMLLGVYASESELPSELLGVTDATAVSSSAGWQTISLINPVTVYPGQTIWLAWVFENNINVRYQEESSIAVQCAATWSDGMTERFGTATADNKNYSIYCTYRIFSLQPNGNYPTLNIYPVTEMSVKPISGTVQYIVECETSWTAQSNTEWCHVTPSGTGNGLIEVDFDENNTSSSRYAYITVTAINSPPVTFGLVQEFYSFSEYNQYCNPSSIYFDGNGGSFKIEVNSNLKWTLISSDPYWLTVVPVSGYGRGNITLYSTGYYNASSSRTAFIYVLFENGHNDVITVEQGPVYQWWPMSVTPQNQYVSNEAGTIGLRVLPARVKETEFDWIANIDKSWCNVISSDIYGLIASFEENTTDKKRVANITLSIPYWPYSYPNESTVTVTQDPNPNVDITAPEVTYFDIPSVSNSTILPVTIFTATDNIAVHGYLLTESSAIPSANDPEWSTTPPRTYNFNSEGTKTLYAWAKDVKGNVSEPIEGLSVIIELQPTFSEYLFEESLGTTVFDTHDSRDGLIINNALRISGVRGEGIELNGSGYITLGQIFSDNVINQITLSAWIKPTSTTGGYQGIIMHGGPNVDTYGLYIHPDKKEIAFKTSGTSNSWSAIENINDLWDGNWHLVTVTYNGTQKIIYLDNNVLVTVDAVGIIESGLGYNLLIGAGRDESDPSLLYNGLIDEVRIYNFALTNAEVNDLFNLVYPQQEIGIIGNTDVYNLVNAASWRRAMPYTFSENGDIQSITIYHNGGTGNMLLGVYADNSGTPGSLLGVTPSTAVSGAEGWQTVNLSSAVSVTSGQTVWLAWVFQNSVAVRFTSGTPSRAQSGASWSSGMPSSFGASTIGTTKFSIYCTYTKAAPPVTTLDVLPVSISLDYNSGANGTFNITSNTSWTITDDATWLEISTVSGTNDLDITVTANSANTSSGIRTATVSITASGGLNKTVTVTQEPEPVVVMTLGNTDVYNLVNAATWRRAMPFTFSENGDIQSITIYHNGGTGNMLLGVYADNSGTPGSLLGVTPSTVVSGAEGWQTLTLSSPVSVNSGQTVWLAWVFQNSVAVRFTSGTPSRAQSGASWSSGMPSSFGASTIGTTKFSIYCTYTKAAPPVTTKDLGNTDVYNLVNAATWRRAMPFTFTENGDIQSISIYHNGGTGNMLLGVYADNSGTPGSLLGVTPSTAVSGAEGWQTVNLSSAVSVTSGQTVWLAWVFQNSVAVRFISGTPSRAQSGASWSSGMPASFGTSTIGTNRFSIYCTYTTLTKSALIATAITPDLEFTDPKVYPNPFSDRLRFEFVSPEAVNAKIDLYDMTGRLIKTVFEQPIEGGVNYEAEFKPETIISGMYIYRITMGDKVSNGKVVFKKE